MDYWYPYLTDSSTGDKIFTKLNVQSKITKWRNARAMHVLPMKRSALSNVTKSCLEAKNCSLLLHELSRGKRNERFYLTLFLRVQTGVLCCSCSYLRYISTTSLITAAHCTCTPTYAIPTRNASYNFSRYTRYAKRMLLFLHRRNTEDHFLRSPVTNLSTANYT